MLLRLILALAALAAAPAFAASSARLENTRVELVSEVAAPAPGQRFTIGLVMKPKPGWHTYWENPGDSGMPTRAEWKVPQGITVSGFRYPVPETYIVAGLMNHVYGEENMLLADVTVPVGASGDLPLKARIDWLVCDDRICIPENAELDLTLPVGDGRTDPAHKSRFDAARAALPVRLAEAASYQTDGKRIRLAVPFADTGAVTAAHFFASGDDSVLFASPQSISRTATALIVETDAVPGAKPAEIPGLLRIERGGDVLGLMITARPGAVAAGQPLTSDVSPKARMTGFWPALGLAILGGLILNLMPCVFPILSLKALSLARAGESAAHARSEGLAYAAGVVLVTSLLGLAAIGISAAGQGAGWAFQLQDPRVVLVLMLLTLAIGLNFAGLYEVNLGAANIGSDLASQPGAKGAFFTGALAAFVATPCTGPFMAGALGAALLLPPVAGLAVFAGLGFGLALPFLAIGFVPSLRRRLPKPGAWMGSFRRILAIPMFLTALALSWVLGRQAGHNALTMGLSLALALSVLLWILGLRQRRQASIVVTVSLAALIALLSPIALARVPEEQDPLTREPGPPGLSAIPFSPQAIAKAQAERHATFLYFTADWCLTCKVNEKGALSDPDVAEAFSDAGIQVMVGDWTRPDPAIARFLEQRGRAGIPLYLFYGKDGRVMELPQILTVDGLTSLASPRSSAG